MDIVQVLAVYRLSPLLLVVETEDGTMAALSLTELHEGGHRVSRVARKDLLEGDQLFTCWLPAGQRHTQRNESSAERRLLDNSVVSLLGFTEPDTRLPHRANTDPGGEC